MDSDDKRKAGQIGGAKRARVLPPRRRSEIAREAALARWSNKPATITHRGNFLSEFGIDVDCYVLDDARKTAVMSQRGMGEALGLGDGGTRLPRFTGTAALAPHLGDELSEKLANPILFQVSAAGTNAPPQTIYGYEASVLIDLCNAIVRAEVAGDLLKRQMPIARQAHIILGASAKSGIQLLVYSLAGYSPSAEEVISAFKLYVQEEAKKYEPEFPPELYREWYRLYEIPPLARGRPWHFKYLTVNHIYYPLAQSSGKIYELLKAHKAAGGDRAKKLFQFLSVIGSRALSRHMGRLLEMAESSRDQEEYEAKVSQRFGIAQQLELPILPPKSNRTKEAAN